MGPEVPEAGRPRHHRQRHRRGRRDRRLGADHAGRHQPAERSGRSASSTAASRCRCRTSTRPTTSRPRPEFRREFAWTPEEAERAPKWSSARRRAHHRYARSHRPRLRARSPSSSKGNPQPCSRSSTRRSRSRAPTSSRSTSCPIRKLVELGLLDAADQDDIVHAEYQGYARNALVQLRRVREGTQIEEDHMRNRQMIVRWLMAHTQGDRGPRSATARRIT